VARANDREMAVVERCQFRLLEALHDRKHGGVNEAERQVGVAAKQLADAPVVLRVEVDDFEPALLGVSQKAQKCIWTQALARKPIQLNNHRRRDEHLLVGGL
jgi:hypothetical protein